MTESTGGSDVGLTETVARRDDESWRLYGRKWFTSAITSQMALTLARPEGNPPGGRGLALFYVETRDVTGRPHNIEVNRLKDKLGTRKVPTAELTLTGTPAQLVKGTADGVRNIAPLLRTVASATALRLNEAAQTDQQSYVRRGSRATPSAHAGAARASGEARTRAPANRPLVPSTSSPKPVNGLAM